jgi:hypothetical protein
LPSDDAETLDEQMLNIRTLTRRLAKISECLGIYQLKI